MANRYWVGGNANWDATAGTKWATTSGGAGGAAVPTAADDVFLDNGTGTGNVTITANAVCRSLNCTGYAGVLTHNASVSITIGDATAGASNVALLLVSGMTYTLGSATTSQISFVSTSTTQQTVTFGGKATGNLTFNGAGGEVAVSRRADGDVDRSDLHVRNPRHQRQVSVRECVVGRGSAYRGS